MRLDGNQRVQVAGCECDWCSDRRRMQRRRSKLIDLGRPSMIRGAEFDQARRKLRLFYARGMSSLMMARASGLSDSTLTQILSMHRSTDVPITGMWRTTYDKIMAIEFAEPTDDCGKYGGARTPPHGTRRRLQALAAVGYGYGWIAEQMGTRKAHAARLANGKVGLNFVAFTTYRRVAQIYAKYKDVNPLDVGVSQFNVTRQIAASRRYRYAPPHCWDDDMIDLPDAAPEWTGACGSNRGWRLHYKHRLPMCQACEEIHAEYDRERRS